MDALAKQRNAKKNKATQRNATQSKTKYRVVQTIGVGIYVS